MVQINLFLAVVLVIGLVYGKPYSPDQIEPTRSSQEDFKTSSDYDTSDATVVKLPIPEQVTTAELPVNSLDLVNNKVDVEREVRDIECADSPPNVSKPCILCNGEISVQVTDDQGFTCDCEVCPPANYMLQACTCNADGSVKTDTYCDVPKPGEGFMHISNVCEIPYPCSECPGDLVSVRGCGPVDDTSCDCPRQHYQTGPETCEPLPLCQEDHERQRGYNPDSALTSYECVPCTDDTYQPYNDSAELCRPRTSSTPAPKNPSTQSPTSGFTVKPISLSGNTTDSSCPPCPTPPECATPTLGDLCDAAVEPETKYWSQVEHIHDNGLMIAVCILVILVPVAFVLGRFPKVICKSIDWLFGSYGSYSVAEPDGTENLTELVDGDSPDLNISRLVTNGGRRINGSTSKQNGKKKSKGKKNKKGSTAL